MYEGLAGKTVVVTGGASGIGLATAKIAVGAGASVVLLDRDQKALDDAMRRLDADAFGIALDVGRPTAVRAAFDMVQRRRGTVHALINAAGVMRYRLLEDSTDADVDSVIGAGLLGPIYTMRSAIPLLRAAGGGDIVNVGSEVTLGYLPRSALYSAAKAGLEKLSAVMTRELRASDIRVTLVVVGNTATGLSGSITPEEREGARADIEASGWRALSGYEAAPASAVAEALLFPLTRPRSQHIDVIHARSWK